ncbi:MAG: aldehyde dehydrogenase family protein [Candidatus Thorarchaeota archaeon]
MAREFPIQAFERILEETGTPMEKRLNPPNLGQFIKWDQPAPNRRRAAKDMQMFGHLIKGEIVQSDDSKTAIFPDMNRAIEDPRILYAMALKEQGSLGRLAARYFSGKLPDRSPEMRLLKDYIRIHGYPSATKDEIEGLYFAEYAIGGAREAAEACNEAYRIRRLMHRELDDKGGGISLHERAESLIHVSQVLWKNYDVFKSIGIAEGTPVNLFDWQTKGVFNTLYKEHIEYATGRISPEEIPCAVSGERTILSRFPYGAVGVFPPYNAAIGLGGMAIISSFWAGNATVTRTPSKMPLTNMQLAYALTDAMRELDFPTSAVQSVIGPAREIADYMINRSPLNAMVYYGDSDVGLSLMAQAVKRGMHFVPELAGSGASLVWKDVDIDKVASYVTNARFFGSGQTCFAAKRLFLHESIYDDFIAALVEKSEQLRVGLPEDSKTDLPIVGTRALYQIIDMIEEALKSGANLEAGGFRLNAQGERDDAGLFYKPTILTNVSLDCKMWYQETFGPVFPIMKISSFEQAIAQANNSRYGLRTSVYSDDPDIWHRFFDEIDAPGVAINTDHLHFDSFYPHLGGLKASGINGGKYFYEILTYLKYRHFPA